MNLVKKIDKLFKYKFLKYHLGWNMFDNTLLRVLEEEVAKEKTKKKKKPVLVLKKEKSLNYYSGWNKDDKPVTQETKEEKQKKLSDIK